MIFGTGRPRAAFCLASGPSLTAEDVSIVRQWRGANTTEERRVVVVNTTFRAALWADAMYASNDSWWRVFGVEVAERFTGTKICHPQSRQRGAVCASSNLPASRCSGEAAVRIAINSGAARVYLLGYDCQKTGESAHWHEDYELLPNAPNISDWLVGFQKLARDTKNAEIINCTRQTALNVFPRAPLARALE